MDKQKKILVTGGTGAMGSVLVRRLYEKGKNIRVLTIPGDPFVSRLDGMDIEIRYGDVANPDAVVGICDGVSTVFHLAAIIITNQEELYNAINIGGTRAVVNEAKKSGVEHFIHISSASVLYPKTTAYSRSKIEAEKIVRESGVPWTIIRPTLVYGKKGGQEFDMFLDYLRKFPVVPFIGQGKSIKRPVYVEDIIDGLVKCESLKRGTGKVYNFSGANEISIIDFARLCLILLGRENTKIVPIPVFVCLIVARIMGQIMKNPPLKWSVIAGITQDANLDPAEAIRDLGYAPSELINTITQCFPRS